MAAEDPNHKMSSERRHIADVLSQIEVMQRSRQIDIESALRHINEATVESVPGAQYVGLTLVDEGSRISTLAATHEYARALDAVQREFREDPCVSAAWSGEIISIDDLDSETRWPSYRQGALDRTPVRSILSVRVHNEGKSLAALNFYSQSADVFNDESVELALIFAAHTSVAWNSLRHQQQFRSALTSRDVIGQAKGMLMERYHIDAVKAFELLRRRSQDTNTKLIDVVERVVEAGRPPAADGTDGGPHRRS